MNQQDQVTFIAQTAAGEVFKEGIKSTRFQTVALNPQLGLIVLAEGQSKNLATTSDKVVEILLDDMQLNLSEIDQHTNTKPADSALHCLIESFSNINEYLLSDTTQSAILDDAEPEAVMLAAVHYSNQHISSCLTGHYALVLSASDDVADTTQSGYENSNKGIQLGVNAEIEPVVSQMGVHPGVVLLFSSIEVIEAVGIDHIRITLNRFKDNLDMALRQINTRAAHNGMMQKPVLVIARIEAVENRKKGWFARITGS